MLGDTLSDANALVETLAHTVAEVASLSEGDIRGNAQALVDTLADSLEDLEAETLWTNTERYAGTGRDAGLHRSRGGG